jgi:hypothetical protein
MERAPVPLLGLRGHLPLSRGHVRRERRVVFSHPIRATSSQRGPQSLSSIGHLRTEASRWLLVDRVIHGGTAAHPLLWVNAREALSACG